MGLAQVPAHGAPSAFGEESAPLEGSGYPLSSRKGRQEQPREAAREPGGGGRRRGTYGVQQDREEQLAPSDALVQLLGASGVLLVEDGVGEQPAGLPREDLGGGAAADMTGRR